jgi:hypothetical protein
MKAILKTALFIATLWYSPFFHAQIISAQSVIGSTSEERSGAMLVLPDQSYVIGVTSAGGQTGMKTTASFGSRDCWLLHYDANNQLIWQLSYGGTGDDWVVDLKLSSDNQILVLCSSDSPISGNKTVDTKGGADAWLFKIDLNGVILWQKDFGTTLWDTPKKVLTHPDLSMYLGFTTNGHDGDFTSQIFGLGEVWLLKLDETGNKIWDKSFGTTDDDQLGDLQIEPMSNHVVVSCSVLQAGTGNMSVSASETGTNCWLFTLDANGNIVQEACIGSGTQSGPAKIIYLNDASLWLMTSTQSDIIGDQTIAHYGQIDTWLVHLDANFAILGQKVFGGTNFDVPISIAYDGTVLQLNLLSNSPLSGNKTQSCRGLNDVWYLMLNASDGEIITQKTIGGSQNEAGVTILTQGSNVRFFIESSSPISGDKQVANYGSNSDIWCLTMSSNLGIADLNSTEFVLSPNPTKDVVILSFEDDLVENRYSLELLNSLGQVFYFSPNLTSNSLIDLSSLCEKGVYYVRIFDASRNEVSMQKIVLE